MRRRRSWHLSGSALLEEDYSKMERAAEVRSESRLSSRLFEMDCEHPGDSSRREGSEINENIS